MTAFLTAGGLGLAILLLSVVLSPTPGTFNRARSGTAAASGLTLFGASGALILINDGAEWLACVLAAALGLAAAAFAGRLNRSAEQDSVQDPYEVVGLTGVAVSRITGAMGEVRLSHPRESSERLAFTAGYIESGSAVVVTEIHGSRVKVAAAPAGG